MFEGITYDYAGAQVLVTGGTNGIGLAIAHAYKEAGASVTITGRKANAGDYDHDLSVFAYAQMDASNKGQIREVAKGLSGLDILVNNAGGSQNVRDSEWDPAGFDAAYDLNLSSMFHMTDACLEHLKASKFKGGPSVIGTASTSAYFGFADAPGYSAVKAAMIQLIKTYASTWAQYGIRANAVSPGFIETNLTRPYLDNLQWNIDNTPLGRIGVPDDIAAAVLFLSSPAASWITGQTLAIDGGFTISK